MAEFILHKGDKVMSHQYGEGVVTAVDEGLCTVRFASRELSFRVPDAFEKGRLIWIGSANFSKKTAKAGKADKPKKSWLGLIIYFLFLIALGLAVVAYPISLLLGTGDKSAILVWVLCVAFFVAMIYPVLKSKKKNGTEPQAPEVEEIESDDADRSDDSGVAAGFLTGMMGGYFLGRSSRHHKSVFDSARDELFWQEKNRHHDDDFTDGESW